MIDDRYIIALQFVVPAHVQFGDLTPYTATVTIILLAVIFWAANPLSIPWLCGWNALVFWNCQELPWSLSRLINWLLWGASLLAHCLDIKWHPCLMASGLFLKDGGPFPCKMQLCGVYEEPQLIWCQDGGGILGHLSLGWRKVMGQKGNVLVNCWRGSGLPGSLWWVSWLILNGIREWCEFGVRRVLEWVPEGEFKRHLLALGSKWQAWNGFLGAVKTCLGCGRPKLYINFTWKCSRWETNRD